MARFKLVKIGRRKVEVQKVRLKLNFGILLVAFACAFLVWLYVKGSTAPMPPEHEGTSPEETVSAQIGAVSDHAWASSLDVVENGGRGCEA